MSIFQTLEQMTQVPWVVWSSIFAAGLLLVSGLLVRSRLAAAGGGVVPDEGLSVRNV